MSEQLIPRMAAQGADSVKGQLMDLQNYTAPGDQIGTGKSQKKYDAGIIWGKSFRWTIRLIAW